MTTKKKAKPRKAAPKQGENLLLGSVMIPVQASINIGGVNQCNELVIEWACLGLAEEPDEIVEVSGNAGLLDARQPPYTDADGLHVWFDPPLTSGVIGLAFNFIYNEAAEARITARKTDVECEKEREERAAKAEA